MRRHIPIYPVPFTHLTSKQSYLYIGLSCHCLLGPFWAWKVGPPNDICPTSTSLGVSLQQGPGWIGGTASSSANGPTGSHAAAEWDHSDG